MIERLDPQKESGPEKNSAPKGINRRRFLQGSLASGVGTVAAVGATLEGLMRVDDVQTWLQDRQLRMRFDRWPSLPRQERESLIAAETSTASEYLRKGDGRRILDSGSDDEIFDLLTALPAFERKYIRDTKFDVLPENWPSVGIIGGPRGLQTLTLTEKGHSSGNGVFISEKSFLTNWHVLKALIEGVDPKTARFFDNASDNAGADIIEVDMSDFPSNILGAPTIYPLENISDELIDGSFVRNPAIDDDETAEQRTKINSSTAFRLTSRVLEALRIPERVGPTLRWHESFAYVPAPGQALHRPERSITGSRVVDAYRGFLSAGRTFSFAQGISGSPVLMDDKLVGITHSATSFEHKGKLLELVFFHAPAAIERARRNGLKYRVPDLSFTDTWGDGDITEESTITDG